MGWWGSGVVGVWCWQEVAETWLEPRWVDRASYLLRTRLALNGPDRVRWVHLLGDPRRQPLRVRVVNIVEKLLELRWERPWRWGGAVGVARRGEVPVNSEG